MKRVLVLGGGFGGIAAAHTLRSKLAPADEIVVVDGRSYFMVGFRKSWALTGESTLDAGQRRLADLTGKGIQVAQGTITRLEPKGRTVEIDGSRTEADAIIVALGAKQAPEKV